MRKFDYSFLNNGLLPAKLTNLTAAIYSLKTASNIKKDDLVAAVSIIDWTSPFPFVCSRVCNQKEQCEKNCTRGKNGESVAIGMLERYVCDNAYDKIPTTLNLIPHNGKSVAIIGAGPSGLSCAEKLILVGFSVDVYDALPFAGGLMEYGIPDFRLDKSYIRHKINFLQSKGVHFILNTIDQLICVGRSVILPTHQR